MRKPQDSDIFGTKSIGYAPRINNESKIDPNAGFQARVDAQYQAYTKKIGSSHRGAFDEKTQQTKVNQNVNFDQNYHHTRKQADLQSSIFYQPSLPSSRVTQRARITQRIVPKHAYNMKDVQYNYGKKQTLQREVRKMPQNMTNFKGNSSNIFGYDEHINRNGVKNKVQKLIPHQMQWNQHDSVRHQDHIISPKSEQLINIMGGEISESRSQVFNIKQHTNKKSQQQNVQLEKAKQNNSKTINMLKKPVEQNPKYQVKIQKIKQTKVLRNDPKLAKDSKESNKVEIIILKGWNSNIMQQLSKYCKLNSTKILSVNFEEGGKGNLVIDRSKRWQSITDWLRKDAKLKIRLAN